VRRTITLALAVVGAWAARPADGGDWPHLRGPSYNAVSAETGLAEAWPEGGPPVVWRTELGQGYSSLVAVGDRLYTQYQTLSGQYVACLSADTGRRLWRRRTGYPWEPEGHWPGPYATPTVADGRVYFADCYGLVGCVRASDGRLVWSVNVTEKFEGEGTEYGYACSPLVEGGKVFLPVGGQGAAVVALDADDGSVVWKSGDEAASYSPAYPITVSGQRQIVAFLRNVVLGLDPRTGQELWRYRWSRSYDEHAAWPVYEEPYLLTAAAFRGGATVLRLDGAGATVAWKSEVLSNDIFSSLIVGGHIYGFDLQDLQPRHTRLARGQLKCIELATGTVRWATDRTGHANVLAADGKLILLNDRGELILARATPERYEELCRTRVFADGVCWTAPTLHRKRLYIRHQTHAACLYLGDPADLAGRPAAGAPPDTPARRSGLAALWRRYEEVCKGESLFAPTLGDALRWFGFCLVGVFGLSALPALAVGLVARRRGQGRWLLPTLVFCGAAFLLGGVGTFVLSVLTGEFVFTWPASLFVAYQGVLWAAARARHGGRGARWLVRAAMVGFVGLCLGYVYLCRNDYLPSIPMGYGFLVGILPAFPVALFVAGRLVASQRRVRGWCLTAGAFSVYFWASALFTVWRT
jgi:outer membrane protein assembly factor BamB